MRIAILTTGTRGDVQPLVALGAALAQRGHAVAMTTPRDLVAFAEAGGIAAVPLPFGAQEVLHSEFGQRFVEDGSLLAFARALMRLDAEHRPQLVEAFARAGEDAEVVIAHPLMVGPALAVVAARGARLVRVALGPTVPTRELPFPLIDVGDLGGALNRLSAVFLLGTLGRGGAATACATAARLGVTPPRGNVHARAEELAALTLHLYSEVLQPRPRDWPSHHIVTGALVLDPATRAQLGEGAPPSGLEEWLAAGDAPVFFGFGSMPVRDPSRLLAIVDDVCAELDVRGLVGAGWSALRPSGGRGARTFVAPAFDHDAVLPRCRAAVHHGGAGTTHAALRAGLPAVVCHFLVDQPYWARRLIANGVGARVPFRHVDAERLVTALRALLDPAVKARAEALAVRLRGDDGVAAAVRLLGA
ncbi:MAG: glycosyltransferase family 1 protein [Deltaproteobacteria bacterium]|nr:glycosyltransferase family 1 protein [Deltaproteobacteria bacterium]